jgi:hypothetical protein
MLCWVFPGVNFTNYSTISTEQVQSLYPRQQDPISSVYTPPFASLPFHITALVRLYPLVITATSAMEMPDDNEAYDADLVASMGFGAFGIQTQSKNKKRRYNREAAGSNSARGSNMLPLGSPKKELVQSQGSIGAGNEEQEQQAPPSPIREYNHTSTLDLLTAAAKTYQSMAEPWRGGSSRDGGGDEQAYYSPSFVENPWRELERILKERDSNTRT